MAIDLQARYRGVPLWGWIGGGTVVVVGGLILLRRYRAARAGNAPTDPYADERYGSPLPGWEGLSEALGPLGGSSPTGPLLGYTSDGTPVYGLGVLASVADAVGSIGQNAEISAAPAVEVAGISSPPSASAYEAPLSSLGITLPGYPAPPAGSTSLPMVDSLGQTVGVVYSPIPTAPQPYIPPVYYNAPENPYNSTRTDFGVGTPEPSQADPNWDYWYQLNNPEAYRLSIS